MKQFMVGSALLMFAWSLPNGATKDSVTIRPQWSVSVEKVAFEQFYGDTLPPMGYVTYCQIHKLDCRPKGPFADRIQLTPARLSELKQVNDQVNTTVVPMTDLEHYGKIEHGSQAKTKPLFPASSARQRGNWSAHALSGLFG